MNEDYALAIANNHGNVTYWTGKYTPRDRPVVRVDKDRARTFKNAKEANFAGAINKGLGLFRAVRLYSDVNEDGFISHWWLPEIED